MAMNDFSVQIGREKKYLIDLGIEKYIVNDAFKKSFSNVSEISLLREQLISEYSEMITAHRLAVLNQKKIIKSKTSSNLDRLIKDKKECLLDFGISLDVINDAFKEREIKSARQLDVIGEHLIAKYFATLDVLETLKTKTVEC